MSVHACIFLNYLGDHAWRASAAASLQTVAIKQLDKHGFQDNKAFLTGVAKLSQLHHENLVDIIGYCADGDQRLLVYESVPAGTLEDHLFGTRLDRWLLQNL